MSRWSGLVISTAVAGVIVFGCAQQPSTTAAVDDKVYTVTPASVTVQEETVKFTVSIGAGK